MKRFIIIGLVSMALILIVSGSILFFALNPLIKKAVETVGPRLTGTSITLREVKISPFTGRGVLRGLVVGNPKGFEAESAFKLSEIRVKLRPLSLLTKHIRIEEIYVDKPEITFEDTTSGSNIGKIQENLGTNGNPKGASAPAKQPTSSKRTEIYDLTVKNAHVSFQAGPVRATLPIPDIHLKNIGKESNGATTPEVVSKVLGAITGEITKAASAAKILPEKSDEKSGGAIGRALKGVFRK